MSTKPAFLLNKPDEPKIRQRQYNGRKLMVWEGRVRIKDIQGWTDNPRITLAKKTFMERTGATTLTQDDVLEIMKNDPEVRLKELRDDIIKNGLREPLTLSYGGKLLDGNRRFYAMVYALESLPPADPNRQDLETAESYVLVEEASEEDERNVLVEENFSASLKIEWPEYVKAVLVKDAHESGLTIEEIADKYSWAKAKIRQTLRIHQLITEYINFATAEIDPEDEYGGGMGMNEQDAENEAARNYQFFNEAQKSFYDELSSDIDFKIQFFKWINEDKFSSFQEVRIAHRAWTDPEAKAAIMQPDPAAAKSAKAILDYNARVICTGNEVTGRIDTFIRFLRDLTAPQIEAIPENALLKLKEAMLLITTLGEAAKK